MRTRTLKALPPPNHVLGRWDVLDSFTVTVAPAPDSDGQGGAALEFVLTAANWRRQVQRMAGACLPGSGALADALPEVATLGAGQDRLNVKLFIPAALAWDLKADLLVCLDADGYRARLQATLEKALALLKGARGAAVTVEAFALYERAG